MGEKRKPSCERLFKKDGKRLAKIELFDMKLWKDHNWWSLGCSDANRYRLRVNGKWNDRVPEKTIKYMTKWEFRDLLFRSLKI